MASFLSINKMQAPFILNHVYKTFQLYSLPNQLSSFLSSSMIFSSSNTELLESQCLLILSFPLPGSLSFPQSIILLVLQTPFRLHLSKICILIRFFSLDPIPQINKAKQKATSSLGLLLLLCVDMTSVPVLTTLWRVLHQHTVNFVDLSSQ